ncbi:MAG: hypothetical protein WBO10_17520 [Pyrinomonadaceae bacterium]
MTQWIYCVKYIIAKTRVIASIYNESLDRLERMVAMGFREGTMAQLQNLDELLAKLSKHE